MNERYLHIDHPGLLATVQDRGRFGWEHVGIARGGAADLPSYLWANRLALNDDDASVLEMTLVGVRVTPSTNCWVATTGAVEIRVDGAERPSWAGFWLHAGSVLEVKKLDGARAYLALNGGIQVEPVLGSRSTNLESGFGGFEGRALRREDRLPLMPAVVHFGPRSVLRHPHPPRYAPPVVACVVLGPRQEAFGPEAPTVFLNSRFRISPRSNHVGLRLDGTPIPTAPRGTRISEPMPIGGVQVTPAGQPIILLGGRGTIGGYPLLATVTTRSVWALGQGRPGDEVHFQQVAPAEARAATIALWRDAPHPVTDSL